MNTDLTVSVRMSRCMAKNSLSWPAKTEEQRNTFMSSDYDNQPLNHELSVIKSGAIHKVLDEGC